MVIPNTLRRVANSIFNPALDPDPASGIKIYDGDFTINKLRMIKQTKTGLKCDCGGEIFTKAIPTTEDGTPSKEIVNMKCVGCGDVINTQDLKPKPKAITK